MLHDPTSPQYVNKRVVLAAIRSVKDKGWDVNPYTVADAAKIPRAWLYQNLELMELIINERRDNQVVEEEAPTSPVRRLEELENHNADLRKEIERLRQEIADLTNQPPALTPSTKPAEVKFNFSEPLTSFTGGSGVGSPIAEVTNASGLFNAVGPAPATHSDYTSLVDLRWKDLETVYSFKAANLKDYSEQLTKASPVTEEEPQAFVEQKQEILSPATPSSDQPAQSQPTKIPAAEAETADQPTQRLPVKDASSEAETADQLPIHQGHLLASNWDQFHKVAAKEQAEPASLFVGFKQTNEIVKPPETASPLDSKTASDQNAAQEQTKSEDQKSIEARVRAASSHVKSSWEVAPILDDSEFYSPDDPYIHESISGPERLFKPPETFRNNIISDSELLAEAEAEAEAKAEDPSVQWQGKAQAEADARVAAETKVQAESKSEIVDPKQSEAPPVFSESAFKDSSLAGPHYMYSSFMPSMPQSAPSIESVQKVEPAKTQSDVSAHTETIEPSNKVIEHIDTAGQPPIPEQVAIVEPSSLSNQGENAAGESEVITGDHPRMRKGKRLASALDINSASVEPPATTPPIIGFEIPPSGEPNSDGMLVLPKTYEQNLQKVEMSEGSELLYSAEAPIKESSKSEEVDDFETDDTVYGDELRELIKSRIQQASEQHSEPSEPIVTPNKDESTKGPKRNKFVGAGKEHEAPANQKVSNRAVPPNIRKACMMLGVRPEELTAEKIQDAWKHLITSPGVHPDLGGDNESAIYLNTAKDALLHWIDTQSPKLGKKFGQPSKEQTKQNPAN